MIKLADYYSPFGTITILKSRRSDLTICREGGCFHSEADHNGISLIAYVHAIFGLVLQAKAQSVLIIGCAGGTLGAMLAHTGRDVTVVDVNPMSFALAKLYFGLSPTIECHIGDGRDFLGSRSTMFDAIVLDAYQGDRVPEPLRSPEFLHLARERLTPCGAVYANVHVDNDLDFTADRLAVAMMDVWHQARVLDLSAFGSRNVIVMAGTVAGRTRPGLVMPPAAET